MPRDTETPQCGDAAPAIALGSSIARPLQRLRKVFCLSANLMTNNIADSKGPYNTELNTRKVGFVDVSDRVHLLMNSRRLLSWCPNFFNCKPIILTLLLPSNLQRIRPNVGTNKQPIVIITFIVPNGG